ncbi:ammonium transporter [Methanohalophilus halophilus]|uniref:Ammonium transporter n=1 Tax=Methanohalophilus halophilus TaxID=2177 RepID=A0A1L3Q4D2_9EURY|nr:ammonium transporter [Methanohalophilus halophilus]APH39739.1 ammonium transporter [Methanohalophilus halophilus]RNI08922.1 ammonium transporter [Methanohalophilus halophilus]SDW38263.1 ammonium transporter [Methanohalophilus halophilus]
MPIDTGDTAFIIICTAMVMLMAPAVGLFYGGMVRSKNLISMITLAFVAFAIVTIQWVTVGYSLAFGSDIAGLIGGLDYLFLEGIGTGGDGIPDLLFMVFQLVFAGVTLTIVTSGVAERIKLSSFIVFGVLWTTLIYDPLAHWAWGGGWAASFGALDFAGGTVVHISSGFAALALALVIGNRTGFGKYSLEPSNIPTTLLGGALLWFGWFAFNAGSALAADGVAVNALVATNIAAASGALSWMVASWVFGKPSSLGLISGAIAGLVAITPACGFVEPIAAIPIGLFAGLVCYGGLILRMRMNLDESLDAWAVHGLGGAWGAVATGIFASATIGGVNGLLYGNPAQLLIQMADVVAVILYAFVATFAIAKIIDMTIGLRVSEEEEYVGLDIAQHGESTSM